MGIARAFIASGSSRTRSTCRRPFSRLASCCAGTGAEIQFRQLVTLLQQEFLRYTFDLFRSAPAFTASGSHGGIGRFAGQGIFSGDDTWQGGGEPSSQQGPSKPDAASSDKSHVAKKSRPLACRCTIPILPPACRFHPSQSRLAGLPTNVGYRVGPFDRHTRENVVKHGQSVIEAVCRRPDRRISQGSFFAEGSELRPTAPMTA